jgi:hypothetical protein
MMMDPRAFITIVGGSVLAAPLAAETQPAVMVARIGLLRSSDGEKEKTGLHQNLNGRLSGCGC